MKRTLTIAGLTGAMALAATTPAMAINKEWSAALGFLGGVMATRTVDYHRSQQGYYRGGYGSGYGGGCRPVVVQQSYCPPPVVVQSYAPPPVIVQQPVYVQQQPSGHYEYREEQQWVEGSWRYEEIGCNTYRKTWCPGFYKTVRVQVWVQDPPCR